MTINIEESLKKAEIECDHLGVRLTDKRCNVLKILLQVGEPLSAYNVIDQYKQRFKAALSAMSAYRMLDFLLQAGLVHKLETTNQYIACSHIACEHTHEIPQFLICDSCHVVKEVGVRKKLLLELNESIKSTGFALHRQQLELHGFCEACREK